MPGLNCKPKEQEMVRTEKDKLHHQKFSLVQAFSCAGRGVRFAFAERNMRIDACFAVLAIILGLVFQISLTSWCAVVLCIALVMSLETLNTALEALVDLVSPEFNELAGKAKDCAAGAALIAACASVVVACFVFLPPFLNIIGF